MDYEYIRLLMLYSDEKYPFEKAKSDPGFSEGLTNVNRYMNKHGANRKFDNSEAHRILLKEKQAREQFMLNKAKGERGGSDDMNPFTDFTPKAENMLNEIETKMNSQSNLENEVVMLRKVLQDKEAELKATKMNEAPKIEEKNVWDKFKFTPQPKQPQEQSKQEIPTDRIIERKLEDTGYSDKINQ